MDDPRQMMLVFRGDSVSCNIISIPLLSVWLDEPGRSERALVTACAPYGVPRNTCMRPQWQITFPKRWREKLRIDTRLVTQKVDKWQEGDRCIWALPTNENDWRKKHTRRLDCSEPVQFAGSRGCCDGWCFCESMRIYMLLSSSQYLGYWSDDKLNPRGKRGKGIHNWHWSWTHWPVRKATFSPWWWFAQKQVLGFLSYTMRVLHLRWAVWSVFKVTSVKKSASNHMFAISHSHWKIIVRSISFSCSYLFPWTKWYHGSLQQRWNPHWKFQTSRYQYKSNCARFR